METEAAHGTVTSDLLRLFAVEPDAVVGYSLGETAGLFATRAWTARDEMLRRMKSSSLFVSDLAGPCDAARRFWHLPADEKVDWVLGVIDRIYRRTEEITDLAKEVAETAKTKRIAGLTEEQIATFGLTFGVSAFMLYMVTVADGAHKTAHYALCTGFMALGMMLPGMWAGWLQAQLGYMSFFVWACVATLPSLER